MDIVPNQNQGIDQTVEPPNTNMSESAIVIDSEEQLPNDDPLPTEKITKYWDPLSGVLSDTDIDACLQDDNKLIKRLDYYQLHPERIKQNLILLILLSLAIWTTLILLHVSPFVFQGASDGMMKIILTIYALVALPPIAYLTKIKNWEKQSTELLISREYNWLYDPAINRNRWLSFSKICPEIFQKGNCKQSIDNQFWGTVNNGQSPFWMACFEYTISSGRSSATYKNLVYAFRLPNNITADFRLTPQNAFTELSAKIHSTLTTESVDFNKEFHVGYKGNENLVGPEILQVLNPSAQEKIMNFRNTCGQFTLAFKQNVMFVAFEKDLKLQYTSFLKKVALDERDSQSIAHNLLSTIELADTILSSISG